MPENSNGDEEVEPTPKEMKKQEKKEAETLSKQKEENNQESETCESTDANAEPEPTKSSYNDHIIDPQKQQRKDRSENQDYVRVLNMFGGGIPQVYVDHISVAQDMVVGEKSKRQAQIIPPPERDSAQVPFWEIRKIQEVYQHPKEYSLAHQALRETRCVVLVGRPRVGKRATAIHLAKEMSARDNAEIWELSPEEDLVDQVKTLSTKSNKVYLVDGLLRDKGQALKPLVAKIILDQLWRHKIYLIVCAMRNVPFPTPLQVIELTPPETPVRLLLKKHLNYYGPLTEEQIESALDNSQVLDLLEQKLAPSQVDRLAKQIAEALRTGSPIETALLGFAAASEKEVRQWFDEVSKDIDAAAFRIALAVFNGARYTAVNAAAQKLAEQLRPQSSKDEEEHIISPFDRPKRSVRLERAHARLTRTPIMTEYSDTAMIEIVKLQDPGYSGALLKYLWTEFDSFRPVFLDWLCRYAVQAPAADLRLRAAGAIGALAALDFEYIRARVFIDWANTSTENPDKRRRNYQALGNALGVLIWDDEHKDDVLGLLRAWVDGGRRNVRWAAARAYTQVGLRYPREAINQWRRILESESSVKLRLTDSFGISIPHPLHMSVVDAVVSLFLRAVELPHSLRPIYEQAIEGLAAWIREDSRDRTSQGYGLPLFLVLTTIMLPPEEVGDPEEWPPAMLYIVGTQPDSAYRRTLAEMWHQALSRADQRPLAISALRRWTECAEKDTEWLEKTLLALLKELLRLPDRGNRIQGILKVYLRRWSNHPRYPLEVASRLVSKLGLD